jgi:hypothetical protein
MKGFCHDADKPTESTEINREIEVIWRVKPCNLGDTHGGLGIT